LLRSGDEVAAAVTHLDAATEPRWFGSVSALAREHGVPVRTPIDPNAPCEIDAVGSLRPDVIFSFYYRRLLGLELLQISTLGALNLHGSLLPRYRGRCPLNWVLVNGETETGVTLHHMIERPDAGDIVARRPIGIAFDDTAATLVGGGAQRRCLTYVDDGTAALLSVLDDSGRCDGEILNIGAPENECSMRELAARLVALAGLATRPVAAAAGT
jgi:methionyl-tRNA formyltransferase